MRRIGNLNDEAVRTGAEIPFEYIDVVSFLPRKRVSGKLVLVSLAGGSRARSAGTKDVTPIVTAPIGGLILEDFMGLKRDRRSPVPKLI